MQRTTRNRTIAMLLTSLVAGACGSEDASSGSGDRDPHVIAIGSFIDEGGTAPSELLAVREINDAGGIRIDGVDYRLDLIREPHGENAEGGVSAVEAFAAQNVVAAVGPPWSSITLGEEWDHSDGAAEAAFNAGILLVSGGATSAAITALDDEDMMWRTIPSDDYQGATAASFVFEARGARRAAIIHRDDAWGIGLADRFASVFESLGGEVIARASYNTEQDLDTYAFPELGKLLEEMPDAIYLAGFDEVAQMTNRMAQTAALARYGDDLPVFMATDGSYFDDLLVNSDPTILANLVGTSPSADPDSEAFQAFVDSYRAAGFGEATTTDPYEYDAVYLIALAIQAAASTDPAEFKQHMRAVSAADEGDLHVMAADWAEAREALLAGEGVDYEGASGPIEFTAEGDPGRGRYALWSVVRAGDGFEFADDQGVDFGIEE